jgi:predicted metal-dependent enzyme (double-stranded beta helix superfamily)
MSEVNDAYSVEDYVADLRRIDREESDDREKCRKLESLSLKLAHTLANQPGGLKEEYFKCDPDQGFGLHLLHEEEDHSLPVFLFSWLPGRGTPVHDHKTWGVVVGISGVETEILWKRRDDGSKPGYADLEHVGNQTLTVDDTSTFLGDAIHTVQNDGEETTLSLHTYGMHINFTGRLQFDPEAKTVEPCVVYKIEGE